MRTNTVCQRQIIQRNIFSAPTNQLACALEFSVFVFMDVLR
jgi:hypothetical protein